MGLSSRTLEITVISGENLNVKEDAYVVVRAESLNYCTTSMTKGNGGFLSWNEKFLLDMPAYARSVTFEVQSNKFKASRPIGVARIAVSVVQLQVEGLGRETKRCYSFHGQGGAASGMPHFHGITAEGNEGFK